LQYVTHAFASVLFTGMHLSADLPAGAPPHRQKRPSNHRSSSFGGVEVRASLGVRLPDWTPCWIRASWFACLLSTPGVAVWAAAGAMTAADINAAMVALIVRVLLGD